MKDEIRLIRSQLERDHQKQSKATPRTCALVLGMHRSGTSALTRVLNLLGCDLPTTLMGADETNEAGHWESTVICKLIDRILASAGTSWDDWGEFNPGWFKSPRMEEFHEEARSVLYEEFGSSRLFVLKDPRICRIVPFWLDVLETAGIRPVIISPVRNPIEVSASLKKRDGFDIAYGHLLWLRNVLDAEFHTRGMSRYFTSYDGLMDQWRRVADDSQSSLEVFWPRYSEQVKAEIDASLSDKYRHHHESTDNVIQNPANSKWLRETYRVLTDWVVSGENQDNYKTLDQIRNEFNISVSAFSGLILPQNEIDRNIAISNGQQEVIKSIEEENEAAQVKIEQLEQLANQRDHVIEELNQKLEDTQKELNFLTAAVSEKNQVLHGFKEHIDILMSDVTEWRTAHLTLQQLHDTKINEINSALEKSHREIARLNMHLHKMENVVHASKEEVAIIRQDAARQLGKAILAFLDCRKWYSLLFRTKIDSKIAYLKQTGILDEEWYLKMYEDVANEGVEPVRHYIEYGAHEGREPNSALSNNNSYIDKGELDKEPVEKTES